MDIGPLNDMQRVLPVRSADVSVETRSHSVHESTPANLTHSASEVVKVVEAIRSQHGLQMEFDREIKRVIVQVTDDRTGEPISQIPTEELVEFMRHFGESLDLSKEGR